MGLAVGLSAGGAVGVDVREVQGLAQFVRLRGGEQVLPDQALQQIHRLALRMGLEDQFINLLHAHRVRPIPRHGQLGGAASRTHVA